MFKIEEAGKLKAELIFIRIQVKISHVIHVEQNFHRCKKIALNFPTRGSLFSAREYHGIA